MIKLGNQTDIDSVRGSKRSQISEQFTNQESVVAITKAEFEKSYPTETFEYYSTKSVKKFVEAIVAPVTFNEIEIKEDEIVLTPGSQSKAALIGRNKRRLLEMKKIVRNYFKKEFRIA